METKRFRKHVGGVAALFVQPFGHRLVRRKRWGMKMEVEPRRIDVITFMAGFNDSTASRLIDLCYTCQEEGSSEIHIFMSSVGGRIQAALSAFNFLQLLTTPIYTCNIGTVDSTSLIVFLASDRRLALAYSKFVLSTFEWTFYRNTAYFPEIIEAYESLERDRRSLVEVFDRKTRQTVDLDACLTGAARVLDPVAAAEAGIVTGGVLARPPIPELAKMWTVHD